MVDTPLETRTIILVPLNTVAAAYAIQTGVDTITTIHAATTIARNLSEADMLTTDDTVYLTPIGIVTLVLRLAKHAIPSQRAMDAYREHMS